MGRRCFRAFASIARQATPHDRRPVTGVLGLAVLCVVCMRSAHAASDWPQWRFDANRSGATEAPGPRQPGLLWRRALPFPDPAYDHQYRMCADATYAPVAAEGLVFVPSNTTDEVVAFDIRSGAIRWRVLTGGPVRFAPAYSEGRVYFGADDGYVYCVAARDGKRLWAVRGAPEAMPDSRLVINGRLCSRWPVRGGLVVHKGVVYFGAGVWPEEGVYVCAVDARTGKLRWRVDSLSLVPDGMSDHGRAYDLSLPPHGYLAVIDGALAVPSARSLAAWFDVATGALAPYTSFYVKTSPPRGTWRLSGVGHYWVQGGNWFGTRPDAAPPIPAALEDAKSALFWSRQAPANETHFVRERPFLRADTYRLHNENLYADPVLTEATLYRSEFTDERRYLVPRGHTRVRYPAFDRIVARDLTAPQWRAVKGRHIRYGRRVVKMLRLEFPLLWELKRPWRVLIKAGDRLYAGGKDTIAAIAIPGKDGAPRVSWRARVDGEPVHALVSDGKLVVVTHNGTVYCFGDGPSRTPEAKPSERQPGPYRSPAQGFAVVLGWRDGVRARALAAGGDRHVVVFEPDRAKAAVARRALAETGLHGRCVQVVAASPADVRLTPYWANLVTADSLEALGSPADVLSVALDLLRPYGGRLLLPGGARHAGLVGRLLSDRTGYRLERAGDDLAVHRAAPPEGAADWTHEMSGPGNTFAGSDRLVKWPLALLWYSGDVDRHFSPASHFQHERHPYPLVMDGRMFIITGRLLHAVDIYTGHYLWRAETPLTPWVRTRSFDSRIYGRPTERNCVVAHDWVYAVTGEQIHAYETATGKLAKVFDIPASLRDQAVTDTHKLQEKRYMGHRAQIQAAPPWTEVRLWGDLLVAMLGRRLAAVDRHSGALRWTRPSTRQTTTYALGDGALFGLDCDEPRIGGSRDTAKRSGRLFALDPATGMVAWEKTLDYSPTPPHNVKHPRIWLRPATPTLAYNAKHRLLVMTVNRNDVHVFTDKGDRVWSKTDAPKGNIQVIYAPVVTDDHVVLSNYRGCFAFLLDVRTGKDLGPDTGIPRPRTCARVIGNQSLLVYRDAATELYDIERNRMVRFNSVRSGCTTSFIPAGGVMTAPMLGHGCVCNYPMFASLGLYHCPAIERVRPAAVVESWRNQARPVAAEQKAVFGSDKCEPVDLARFRLVNATAKASGAAVLFRVKDSKAGYAVRPTDRPLEKAVFRFAVKRAAPELGQRRHGNAFFVCGSGESPKDWIECRLYYGGRSSLMITGSLAEHVEQKIDIGARQTFTVTVTVDCKARTVAVEAAGKTLTSRITGPIDALTHYGYGGGNSANWFTAITVR